MGGVMEIGGLRAGCTWYEQVLVAVNGVEDWTGAIRMQGSGAGHP